MTMYIDFEVGQSRTTQSASDYLMFGCMPGGFLEAVLCNDLFRASNNADHQNREILANIAFSVFQNFPNGSFGNEQIMMDWVRDVDGRRAAWALAAEKAYTWRVLKGEEDENAPRPTF